MLPGFRFLVAAIVFAISVLVFGLGAATLFRAAHEQFASNSSWRAPSTTSFSTFLPPPESPAPVLALMRVEPSTPPQVIPAPQPSEIRTSVASLDAPAETDLPDSATAETANTASDVAPVSPPTPPAVPDTVNVDTAPASPELSQVELAKPERLSADTTASAALATPDMSKPDIARPDIAIAPQTVAMAGPVTTGISPDHHDASLATFTAAQAMASADIVTGNNPVPSPLAASTITPKPAASAVKIAPAAGQPVASEKKASIRIASVQLHRSLAKKRLAKERLAKERLAQARRAKQQREMAQRARASQQEAYARQQQQYADPFAQPPGFGQQALGQQTAQRTR